VTLAEDDYNSWKLARPEDAKWLGPPYAICIIHLVDILREHVEISGSNDEIFYTIESSSRSPGEKRAKRHLNKIMANDTVRSYLRMRNFIFIPKNHKPDSYVLRTADLLVHQWQRNLAELEESEAFGKQDSGWTEPFKLLFPHAESEPIQHWRINARALNNTALWGVKMRLHPKL
jgi:hypothetical protein